MTVSERERDAIAVYLETRNEGLQVSQHRRQLREQLFSRTRQEPEKVLKFLNSRPKSAEQRDPLLKLLRKIATEATLGMSASVSQ